MRGFLCAEFEDGEFARARRVLCVFCVCLLRGGQDEGAVEGADCARAGGFRAKACGSRQGLKAVGVSRGFVGLGGWKTCADDRKNLKSAR
jgi:hypothetical protein